ncbi:MAG: hypothetical protein KAI66_24755, partial [Lentisphaeria bacterium]|nr:hypothetical protein [Lentisphaeria bacterium]
LYFDAPSGSATFREPLNPRKEAVERYIVQHCKRMFFTYGLQAFALLQALHWFADFLEDNGQGNDASREQLRETCRTLYKKLCETIHPTDDGLALFQTFPDYPFATSPGETP